MPGPVASASGPAIIARFYEILCLWGLAEAFVDVPEIVHKKIDRKIQALQHQRHGASLPT